MQFFFKIFFSGKVPRFYFLSTFDNEKGQSALVCFFFLDLFSGRGSGFLFFVNICNEKGQLGCSFLDFFTGGYAFLFF
jgi:hypothetical protein